MERQIDTQAPLPSLEQRLVDRGKAQGLREGRIAGRIEGFHAGEIKGKRDALLRLIARAGIALGVDDRTRIQACMEPAILDRWIENVLTAKTGADVLV